MVAIEADLRGIPSGERPISAGTPQGLGFGFRETLYMASVFVTCNAGGSGSMRENNPLLCARTSLSTSKAVRRKSRILGEIPSPGMPCATSCWEHGRRSGVRPVRRIWLGLDIHRHRAHAAGSAAAASARHVCTSDFDQAVAALQPLSRMGLARTRYGRSGPPIRCTRNEAGLAAWITSFRQYLSDHFTNQIKFWRTSSRPTPSSNVLRRPTASSDEVRGRTLHEEQIIHGRIYRNIGGAAERRPRVRRTPYNGASLIVPRENELPENRRFIARQAWHLLRDVTQARRSA